jgi:hypothetical protein
MQFKMGEDDASRLDRLFEEHWGPAAAVALTDHEELWTNRPMFGSGAGATGAMDSLDKVEFLMAVEDEFDIEITDTVAQGLNTKKALIEYLGPVLASKNADPH